MRQVNLISSDTPSTAATCDCVWCPGLALVVTPLCFSNFSLWCKLLRRRVAPFLTAVRKVSSSGQKPQADPVAEPPARGFDPASLTS